MKSQNELSQQNPTYQQLEDFVKTIASLDMSSDIPLAVLSAKARVLLHIEPVPFTTDIIDRIVEQYNYDGDEFFDNGHICDDIQALCIKYGSLPVKYIVEKFERDGVTGDWRNMVDVLGQLDHEESRDLRRHCLEKLLITTKSPSLQYSILMNMSYSDDPESIEIIQKFIDGDIVDSVKKDARQVLRQLLKTAVSEQD